MAQARPRARRARGSGLPFRLRPGSIAEMLRFYDQLRRQSQQVKRFEELIDEALGAGRFDRGARSGCACRRGSWRERFATTSGASRRSGGCRRAHAARAADRRSPPPIPIRHVIVTVPGLDRRCRRPVSVADFDLLTRIPGLERSTSSPPSACSRPASTSACTPGGRGSKRWRRQGAERRAAVEADARHAAGR